MCAWYVAAAACKSMLSTRTAGHRTVSRSAAWSNQPTTFAVISTGQLDWWVAQVAIVPCTFSVVVFSALTLFARWQEGQMACKKKLKCCLAGGDDLGTNGFHISELSIWSPLPSCAAVKFDILIPSYLGCPRNWPLNQCSSSSSLATDICCVFEGCLSRARWACSLVTICGDACPLSCVSAEACLTGWPNAQDCRDGGS